MDQFVSTYRKDFLWPYIRTFGRKPDAATMGGGEPSDMIACRCVGQAEEEMKLLAPNIYDKDVYMKSGPATPLMDPKLYPARVGPPPESESQRFNQPNVFLEKLKLKYPFLYEVLKSAPPDDLMSRINKNRLRTTYEVDFCNLQEYPAAPYDELLRASGVRGLPPCPEPERLPGDPCRPNQRPSAFKASAGGGLIAPKFGEKCGGGAIYPATGPVIPSRMAIVGMGSSEYQDAVSKLGGLIIRNKIHHRPHK
ncbi:uncharacterized protein [Atheta coriaria]|uniref:uncharacterized protein isoform X1 n=1 Tax=Dalotia coriaria TaxID=877792 RepID=UPI0031F3FF76